MAYSISLEETQEEFARSPLYPPPTYTEFTEDSQTFCRACYGARADGSAKREFGNVAADNGLTICRLIQIVQLRNEELLALTGVGIQELPV